LAPAGAVWRESADDERRRPMTSGVGPEGAGGDAAAEDRARQAAAHLQRATLELIEAARAVLDVAEEAVREPGGVMVVLTETLGGLAEAVGTVAPGWVERGRRASAVPDDTEAPAPAKPPRRKPGVEHIRIS